ncbi:nuclear transport factor 2 family protein [Streptodolium elevatio]
MTKDLAAAAREAVLAHVRHWNNQDKDSWLKILADDVRYEDPPGTVAGIGRDVMSVQAWDKSFTPDKTWILEPLLVIACGREAQVHMRNHGSVAGKPAWVDSIELWRVNDEGLVDSVRAFWEPPAEIRSHLGLSTWEGATALDDK